MLHSYVKYGVSVVAGAFIATVLLYVMQSVISTEKDPLNEAKKVRIMEFVRVIEEHEPIIYILELDEPPPPDEMPPKVDDIILSPEGDPTEIITIKLGPIAGPDLWGSGGWQTEGEYTPLNYVRPEYPSRALQRGIEGYVTLKYTVTADGTVENPVIVEETPPGVFGRSAIRAALKFKYRPRIVNGRAVAVDGVRNKIIFELEE